MHHPPNATGDTMYSQHPPAAMAYAYNGSQQQQQTHSSADAHVNQQPHLYSNGTMSPLPAYPAAAMQYESSHDMSRRNSIASTYLPQTENQYSSGALSPTAYFRSSSLTESLSGSPSGSSNLMEVNNLINHLGTQLAAKQQQSPSSVPGQFAVTASHSHQSQPPPSASPTDVSQQLQQLLAGRSTQNFIPPTFNASHPQHPPHPFQFQPPHPPSQHPSNVSTPTSLPATPVYADPLQYYNTSSPYTTTNLPSGAPHSHPPAPPRAHVSMACAACYAAKSACSGERPCERCIRLGREAECIDRPYKKRQPRSKQSAENDEQKRKQAKSEELQSPPAATNSHTATDQQTTTAKTETNMESDNVDEYDESLEFEDDLSAEQRLMSKVVLKLLLKMTPQLHQYLRKSKLHPIVTLNIIFSYFAQALLPDDFDFLVSAMLQRESLKQLIEDADPTGSLFKRRYVWDYTDSPLSAFPDPSIVPTVPTIVNTSVAIHPHRVNYQPNEHEVVLPSGARKQTPDHKPNDAKQIQENNEPNEIQSPATSTVTLPKAVTTDVQNPIEEEDDIPETGSANNASNLATSNATTSNRSSATNSAQRANGSVSFGSTSNLEVTAEGGSSVSSSFLNNDSTNSSTRQKITVKSEPVNVEQIAKSMMNNPDAVVIKKSIVVSREFERVFGWNQEDIRNIHIHRQTMGVWSLSRAFHQFRNCRNAAKVAQQNLSDDAPAKRKELREAEAVLKKDIAKLWLSHHHASTQGLTQFQQRVVMTSKRGEEIECIMSVRYGSNNDGISSTTSTTFTPIPAKDD